MNNFRKSLIAVLLFLFLALAFAHHVLSQDNGVAFNKNILEFMQDGMESDEVKEICKEEIELVENAHKNNLTSVDINIRYHDVDLNDDGLEDKIIIIGSSLHTGSAGDTFKIFINKKTYYESVEAFSNIELLNGNFEPLPEDYTSVYILPQITNGYHDIDIKSYKDIFTLKFSTGKYDIYK